MTETEETRELWILGGGGAERRETIDAFLAHGGYRAREATVEQLAAGRPLGIILDISPFSADGWGQLLRIKANPATRNIPVLPVYLNEEGKIGGVFPVAGFFTVPVDDAYLTERLAVFGLTRDAEDYDLQTLIVTRKGEEAVSRTLHHLGFEVVNAYTGKEAVALSTTGHQYMIFCALMLADMMVFELMERLRLYPQTKNIPIFVLIKEGMKEGERLAMSRQIENLVRKKELSREEFLGYLRRRG